MTDPSSCTLGERFWLTSPLLLTATIHVAQGLSDSPIANAQARERDYFDCLRFYLAQPTIERVVFVENSGADLERFRTLGSAARLELVSLDNNSFPSEFGKGYGEAQLIDEALRRSRMLAQAPAFMKATGRILLRNISSLVQRIDPTSSGHFDVRDHDLYERLRLRASAHHADTRFFVVSQALFSAHFRHLHLAHGSGTFSIEANYLKAIRRAQSDGWSVRDRFAIEPVYGGTAGHGKNYDALPERTKRFVRGSLRRVWPSLKI